MSAASLPRSTRVGYGLGSFCTGTFGTVPGLLLLYYLTNALDVPAWTAGAVIFLPKAWDIFINPYVGRVSDRTESRHGPRRPWLLAGAATLPVTFALTFAGPPLRGGGAAVYVFVVFLLASTAYALFEVPYKAMPSEMTSDYHEQSVVLTWRMGFLGVAILLSGAVAPLIVNAGGDNPTIGGYRTMGVVTAVILLLAMIGTYHGTAKAPRVARAQAEPSLRAQLAVARGSKTFLCLLVFSSLQMLAAGTMLAGAPYFATYILKDVHATTTLFLALVGPIVVTMPLWVRLSRRYDKRGGMLLASVLFLAGGFGLVATRTFGSAYAHACVAVVGLGYAGLQLLQFSMLADTLVADALSSGKRRAGVFTGLWTAAETVTFALGGLLLGAILGISGFVSSEADKPVPQPDSAITAVLVGGTVIPAALVAVGIIFTLRYDLTAARLKELEARARPAAEPV